MTREYFYIICSPFKYEKVVYYEFINVFYVFSMKTHWLSQKIAFGEEMIFCSMKEYIYIYINVL